jgi:hypothetical protein
LHLSGGLLSSLKAQQSARTTTESDGAAVAVIEHRDGLHLDIAHDPRGGIVAVGGQREAAVEQDPRGVELHAGEAVEHEADLGERDSAHAGEVVAGVELAVGGGGALRRHPPPERCAQRPVRRQREARDRGARVQRRAAANTTGGTLSLCLATTMAWSLTMYIVGACAFFSMGVSAYRVLDVLGTPRTKKPWWLAVGGKQ